MHKRIALVLALLGMLAMVVLPQAALAEDEVGNIVAWAYGNNPVCIDALDGSTVHNCHFQPSYRAYEPVKFDGLLPKMYMVSSGPAKAFVFVQRNQDNVVNWAWAVPAGWHPMMGVPPHPGMMWKYPMNGLYPGSPTSVTVNQDVNVKGSASVSQDVSVKSGGPTTVQVTQQVNVTAPAPVAKLGSGKPKGPACFTYTIKKGDNLTKIAVRFGDSVKGLAMRNHITNPSKIYFGQRITVCDP